MNDEHRDALRRSGDVPTVDVQEAPTSAAVPLVERREPEPTSESSAPSGLSSGLASAGTSGATPEEAMLLGDATRTRRFAWASLGFTLVCLGVVPFFDGDRELERLLLLALGMVAASFLVLGVRLRDPSRYAMPEGMVETVYQVVHCMPPRPSETARLHPDVDLALAVGLAKEPGLRFDRAEDLAVALAAAGRGRLDAGLRLRAQRILAGHPWGSDQMTPRAVPLPRERHKADR